MNATKKVGEPRSLRIADFDLKSEEISNRN